MPLEPRLRQELVEAILKTPIGRDYNGRSTLLAGLSIGPLFFRDDANDEKDLRLIVSQLEERLFDYSDPRLVQLIDNVIGTVRGTELGTTLLSIRTTVEELRGRVRTRTAETGQVHLFDLRSLVLRCISHLPDCRGGVFGFVVPAATPRLLRYFCDSLRYRGEKSEYWQRNQVAPPNDVLVVAPMYMSVAGAIERLKKAGPLLAQKHVLWPAYVESEADAAALWQGAAAAFKDPLKCLVIVFGTPEKTGPPAGMIPLPSPRFMKDDVSSWMTDIVKAKSWREVVIERSTRVIAMGAVGEDSLPIDLTYTRLERYHGLLNEHDTDDAMLEALDALEQLM